MVKKGYYGNECFGLARDCIEVFRNHTRVYENCIKVFEIVFRNHIRVQNYWNTNLNSHNNSLLAEKMVKNEYYGNEGFGLPRDRTKVRQMNPFTTTSLQNCVFFQEIKTQSSYHHMGYMPQNFKVICSVTRLRDQLLFAKV